MFFFARVTCNAEGGARGCMSVGLEIGATLRRGCWFHDCFWRRRCAVMGHGLRDIRKWLESQA